MNKINLITFKLLFSIIALYCIESCKKDNTPTSINTNSSNSKLDTPITIVPTVPVITDSTYLFNIPDSKAFDDSKMQSGAVGYFSNYNGYYIANKNGKRIVGCAALSSLIYRGDTCRFDFIQKNKTGVEIDNQFSMYEFPLQVGIHKPLKDYGYYVEDDECSTRAFYNFDASKCSFIKILSIEKNSTTHRVTVRGRFKFYFVLESMRKGDSFPEKLAFEEGAFLVNELAPK